MQRSYICSMHHLTRFSRINIIYRGMLHPHKEVQTIISDLQNNDLIKKWKAFLYSPVIGVLHFFNESELVITDHQFVVYGRKPWSNDLLMDRT